MSLLSSSGDGPVVQGSEVTVRKTSGQPVLVMTTDSDQSISHLTEYCRRKCALSETIPEVCVSLIWEPPVPIRQPAEFGMQPDSIPTPIHMEATLNIKRIPSDDDFHDKMQEYPNRCVVCYDVCLPDPLFSRYTSCFPDNCIRCVPDTLCVNCKGEVTKGDEVSAICLDCILPKEIPLLNETQAIRRLLVFQLQRCHCPQPTDRMALLPGEKDYRCVKCSKKHPIQSA